MTDQLSPAAAVVARQMDRSGNTLLLALETAGDEEFFAGNANGLSAAWVVGHLACVADLFSSWFDDGRLLLGASFHAVFNETAVVAAGPVSKAESVDRGQFPKTLLMLELRRAMVKALRVLAAFDAGQWDTAGPPGIPASLVTGGAVWEVLAAHVYWHCGELAGSMPRFFGAYTLNILPHFLYYQGSKGEGSA